MVELSAPGISWSTNELTVAQGDTIHLVNDGSGGPHNFVVEGYNDDAPVDMPAPSEVDWVVPDDLAAALDTHPGARERWDALSRSVRRGALEQIVQAKRPETRAKRVAEFALVTAQGERPGQWRPGS